MQTQDGVKLLLPAMLAILDPGPAFDHLALESLLLHRAPLDTRAFILYRCVASVVIGKHQIPWEQVRLARLERDGIPVARRITGGGTVWHDPGNLNWCFLEPADLRSRPQRLELIISGLRSIGLPAEPGERGDIWIADRKVSGTALAYRRGLVLHHGTLLVSADLARIRQYLAGPKGTFRGRGVASVPSPVVNLSDIRPGLRPPDLVAPLLLHAGRESGSTLPETALRTAPEALAAVIPGMTAGEAAVQIREEAMRLAGWEWVFGRSPEFRYSCAPDGPELLVSGGRLSGARDRDDRAVDLPVSLRDLALSPGELDRVPLAPQSRGILSCLRQLFG